MFKIIKKKEMITDAGVHERGNHVDVIIITLCILMTGILAYLAFMAYYTA